MSTFNLERVSAHLSSVPAAVWAAVFSASLSTWLGHLTTKWRRIAEWRGKQRTDTLWECYRAALRLALDVEAMLGHVEASDWLRLTREEMRSRLDFEVCRPDRRDLALSREQAEYILPNTILAAIDDMLKFAGAARQRLVDAVLPWEFAAPSPAQLVERRQKQAKVEQEINALRGEAIALRNHLKKRIGPQARH